MPKREFTVGGIYHIFNRGVDKRKIFEKRQDYSRFVLGLYFYNDSSPKYSIWTNLQNRRERTLSVVNTKNSTPIALPGSAIGVDEREVIVEVLAFCLMPNHYHLVLKEITAGGISAFMHKMKGYSQYFNKQYNRSGALFQGRYKAVPIKNDKQLTSIFSYVHSNPVELVESEWKDLKVRNPRRALDYLNKYKWSSYRDYVSKGDFPLVTQRDFFLDYFGGKEACRDAVEDWVQFKAENSGFTPPL